QVSPGPAVTPPTASATASPGTTARESPSPTTTSSPPGTSTSPTATRPRSEGPSGPHSVTINFSGDLLWHDTLWESARVDGGGSMDFAPQLAALEERVGAADVAICHSEVPFAEAGGPYSD